jgi:hypothetical protein
MKLPMPKWMLGHDAENFANAKWERTKREIEEEKEWTPRDWGKGIDLNIEDEDEPAKIETKDVPIPTESADILSNNS